MRIRTLASRKVFLPLVSALAIGALLAGCSGETEPPAMPFQTVAMPAETAPTATPGQHLATGEIALLAQTDFKGVAGDPIETTVIGVAQGTAGYWDTFENGAEFKNETPFFAVVQYRWVTGDVSAYSTPTLRPLLEDGSEGGSVEREYFGSMTANTACPFDIGRFDLEKDRGPNEYIACVLYTAPIGSTVVGLAWYNVSDMIFSEPDPEVNPFYADPVVWDVTPIQPKKSS